MTSSYNLAFIIGAPRSGTTMLERMLASHSMIKGGPETHLLTPLAHLGYWRRVDKAPYDHIVATIGQQAFVDALPGKEQDYWKACKAYCDVLYTAYMDGGTQSICLDKTPEYAMVWPFIVNLFPKAKYVVLTRHPGAIFSSFAGSFFGGDYEATHNHDPILERYIPSIAGLLRQNSVETFHVSYEDLVQDPEYWMRKLCDYLEIPYEPGMVEYGNSVDQSAAEGGLGDPIGVGKHSRPTNSNVHSWANEVASDEAKLKLMKSMIDSLDENDLNEIGYPKNTLWSPLEEISGADSGKKRSSLTSYQLQRKIIVKGRNFVRRSKRARAVLQWFRMACDVMLREY